MRCIFSDKHVKSINWNVFSERILGRVEDTCYYLLLKLGRSANSRLFRDWYHVFRLPTYLQVGGDLLKG